MIAILRAHEAELRAAGIDQDGFERYGQLRDAVDRCLERFCEAVNRLGSRAEPLMPGQPWKDIRGMGNRLRHAYDRISIESFGARSGTTYPISKQRHAEAWRTLSPVAMTLLDVHPSPRP